MTPESWAELKGVLERALTLDADSRAAFLRQLPDDVREAALSYLQADLARLDALLPTGGAAAALPLEALAATDDAPEVLANRYRIEGALGRGGMGAVHRAHDVVLDRPVAIKRLRNALLPDEEALRRLRREGRAIAALNHPGIARVQDVLDGPPPALVLEYVPGRTLDVWVRGQRTPGEIVGILRQVAEAVAFAHGKGLVHCDLKPANVLVTEDGRAKVIDFGIALMLSRAATSDGAAASTQTTWRTAFTPKYAAPEVMRGERPTPASDVYSLGVVIDEVLTLLDAAGQPLPRRLTTALRGVALRARSEQPQDRYLDGAAILKALPEVASTSAAGIASYLRTRAATAVVILGACVSSGLSLIGDGRLSAAAMPQAPVLAVVTRVDEASAGTVSAAAADILRRSLGPLRKARLADRAPAFEKDLDSLLAELQFEGLTHVLVPSVAAVGSNIKVSVALRQASDGAVLKTATRIGPPDTLEALTRGVAAEIRDWLGEPRRQESRPLQELSVRSAAQYSEARRYLERPDRPEALTHARGLLEAVTQRDAHYAPAHAELARVLVLTYRQQPDPTLLVQARNAADRAVRLRPDLPDARIALANVYSVTGRRDDANAELKAVLADDPTHEHALRLLGQNEAARGHVEEGIAILRKLISLHESWVNYRALGTVYWNDGRNEEALAHFRALTELQPDNPWGYQMLGAAHHALQQFDQAVAAYERSIALGPSASALSNLATVHYQRGDLREAERRYSEAAALQPNDPVFLRNLADVQLLLGRGEQARVTYGRAVGAAEALLEIDESDVRARGNATYASARAGDCARAMTHAARLESLAARQVAALANLANAYALCGRFSEARSALERLQARNGRAWQSLEQDVQKLLGQRSEFRAFTPAR